MIQYVQEYHGQAEAVIDRVLTGELSPALQNLDQSMALQPLGATSSQANKPRAVERLYDGDQFDVNTNDSFDMSRVSRGKKFVVCDSLPILFMGVLRALCCW